MQRILFTLVIFLSTLAIIAQDCNTTYVDSGGTAAPYLAHELDTVTLCPNIAGEVIQVEFTFVDLESTAFTGSQDGCYDFLTIYNGNSTTSAVLAATLCGEPSGDGGVPSVASSNLSIGDTFISTDASGCLTITFDSDGSIQEEGWEANVICIDTSTCSITSAGLIVNDCDPNGTVTDPSDDTFTFSLNPTGLMVGSTFTVSGNATGNGTYGTQVTYDNGGLGFPIGTDLFITITDDADPACSIELTIPSPASCSNSILFECTDIFIDSGSDTLDYQNNELIEYVVCSDVPNSVVSLEFVFFDTESFYDDLTIYEGIGTAGTSLGVFSGTTLPPVFTSTDASGCLTAVFESDGSVTSAGWEANVICIDTSTCNILDAGLIVNACDDNGTPADPIDDTFSFSLDPTGNSFSAFYNVTGDVTATGNYGSATTFDNGGAGFPTGVDLNIIIVDSEFGFCRDSILVTAPAACSNTILLGCDDVFTDSGADTLDYQNDELQEFILCPDVPNTTISLSFISFATESCCDALTIYEGVGTTGINLGVFAGTTLPPNILSTDASGCLTAVFDSDLSITAAGWEATVSCIDTNVCNILSANAIVGLCNDGGTADISTDDTFDFTLDPTGLSLVGTYTVSGGATGSGTYGTPLTISGNIAGSGDITIVLTDDADPACSYTVTITDPGSCSPIPVCGETWYDSGGQTGTYTSNENDTITICPANTGDVLEITFTYVDIETSGTGCYDVLSVYDGADVNAPSLGDWCGEESGDGDVAGAAANNLAVGTVFTSSDASGCLTFVFESDFSVQETGWETTVVCLSNCTDTLILANNPELAGLYEGDDVIKSTSTVDAGSGGDVTYNAGANVGEYILLDIGFVADGAVTFEAENIDCDATDNP